MTAQSDIATNITHVPTAGLCVAHPDNDDDDDVGPNPGEQMLDYDRKLPSFETYSYNNAYNGHGMHRGTRWSKTDWRDVVLPAFPYSHHYTQGMSYLLRGLDSDQQYEARVQSR